MFYGLMAWLHATLYVAGRRALARERGQGTVEYVGLVLLLAVVLAAVVAAAKSENFKLDDLVFGKLKEAIGNIRLK